MSHIDPGDQQVPTYTSTDPDQQGLFDAPFDGSDYVDSRDRPRLTKQLQAVHDVMADGEWHTIEYVTNATGYPQQSVARQIRYLRAEKFGGHTVEKRYVSSGLYEFRVTT